MEDNTDPTPSTPNTNQPPSQQEPDQIQQANQIPTQQPQPSPTNSTASAEDPGKTTGIIALILAFFIPLVGLIVGIIARSTSKKAGFKNTPALIAIILSSIIMILTIIALTLVIVFGTIAGIQTAEKCKKLGPGVHYEGNITYTCNTDGSGSSSTGTGTNTNFQNTY